MKNSILKTITFSLITSSHFASSSNFFSSSLTHSSRDFLSLSSLPFSLFFPFFSSLSPFLTYFFPSFQSIRMVCFQCENNQNDEDRIQKYFSWQEKNAWIPSLKEERKNRKRERNKRKNRKKKKERRQERKEKMQSYSLKEGKKFDGKKKICISHSCSFILSSFSFFFFFPSSLSLPLYSLLVEKKEEKKIRKCPKDLLHWNEKKDESRMFMPSNIWIMI